MVVFTSKKLWSKRTHYTLPVRLKACFLQFHRESPFKALPIDTPRGPKDVLRGEKRTSVVKLGALNTVAYPRPVCQQTQRKWDN